jgi:hypothetical protein
MALVDLQPTTEETIEKLGLSLHDLWIVKIGDEVFGPYECESLRHYAGENQDLFEAASVARANSTEWHSFFTNPLFQRRGPQVLKTASELEQKIHYWVLDLGQKHGPFNRGDLDKRIELGSIGLTDLVSTDDGHIWRKLYEVEGFDRRFHSGSELPFAPLESNFQKHRLELMDKIDREAGLLRTSEGLAEMAHSAPAPGKVLFFNPEDMPLRSVNEIPMSENFKWQLPLAFGAMMALVVGVFTLGGNNEETIELSDVENSKMIRPPQNNASNPSHQLQNDRSPASVQNRPYEPRQMPRPIQHESQYPTHIETHHNDAPAEPNHFQDPPQEENREPASQEHSLVNAQPDDNMPLDAAMGNPRPPAEEISDF